MFKNGWWGDASPTSPLDPPLPAPITMSLTTTPTSQFGFSMMWGKFCHSCFETTARTALAVWTLHFKHKVSTTQIPPPWVRHWLNHKHDTLSHKNMQIQMTFRREKKDNYCEQFLSLNRRCKKSKTVQRSITGLLQFNHA